MNNFGIYKLFSNLTASKDAKNKEKAPKDSALNGEFLSALLKNLDLDAIKNLITSFNSIANITSENKQTTQAKTPTNSTVKRKSDGINAFFKSHDDFVKKVLKNNGATNTDF
jgi:hypothetical protein